jgi:glycosyltransferase involved in cell wall biosynthesis
VDKEKFSPEQIAEVEAKRKRINEKLDGDEALTPEELWIMGEQMVLDVLPQFAQCEDMYYRRLYLQYEGDMGPLIPPLSEAHINNFQVLVQKWLSILREPFGNDILLAASQKETKLEMVELSKKWELHPQISADEKDDDVFKLMAWSKFRHVLVRKIFDLHIKHEYFSIYLNGKEIRFNAESAMHILSRHFGHGMKPYNSTKDHFYGVFRHDRLHEDFNELFCAIDQSGVYAHDNVTDINIRYQNVIYKIWSVQVDENTYRISTFFPISSAQILGKIDQQYYEVQISDKLSVFIKQE